MNKLYLSEPLFRIIRVVFEKIIRQINSHLLNAVCILCVVITYSLLISEDLSAQTNNSNYPLVIHTYNQKGNPEKAGECIQQLTFEQQKNDDIQFMIAENAYLLKDYNKAAGIFYEINKLDSRKANYELARCYARLGKADLAVKHLQIHLESTNKLMQRDITSDEAFFSIYNSKEWNTLWQQEWYSKYDVMFEEAWIEYENENYEDALRILNQLNAIRKSLVEAYFLKTLVYLKLNEPENALVSIDMAIDKRNKIAKYYALKADVEVQLNKSKKALQTISTAIQMDSTQINFYFVRAKAYLKGEKLESAVNDLDAIMAMVPDFDVYKLAGEIYSEGGEYQSALKAYNKCITLQKYNAELYIERGEIYAKLGAFEFAENDLTFALDFKPYDGELFYKRGIARKMQRKTDLACQDFHKAFNYKYMKADDELRGYCQGR